MLNKPCKIINQDNGTIKIYGNGHARELLYFFELPEKYQKIALEDYDYMDDIEEEGIFFVYKNQLYSLDDFQNIHNKIYNPNPPAWMLGYDGYNNDSFFSGLLIKFPDNDDWDNENGIIVYTFIAG